MTGAILDEQCTPVAPVCLDCGVSIKALAQLNAGFRAPDTMPAGTLLPLRRVSDSTKKHTLTTPRMTTPERRALVTALIRNAGGDGWPGGGGGYVRYNVMLVLMPVYPSHTSALLYILHKLFVCNL